MNKNKIIIGMLVLLVIALSVYAADLKTRDLKHTQYINEQATERGLTNTQVEEELLIEYIDSEISEDILAEYKKMTLKCRTHCTDTQKEALITTLHSYLDR